MVAWTTDVALALSSRLDLAIVAKATIILAIGLTAAPLARRARASVRHLLLAATLGTLLVLPAGVGTLPAVTIRVPADREQHVEDAASGEARTMLAPAISLSAAPGESGRSFHSPVSLAMLLRAVWAGGAVFLLALLAIDLRRLRALRRGGLPWPAQRDLARSLTSAAGLRRSVDVLLHEDVGSPVTCGVLRPAILLPVDASEWPAADVRRALVHELEHIRRGDWVTQLVARVVCACYWFHPLVWTARRRLCLEAERACDDAVVQSAERTEYAQQLVSLARRLTTGRALPSLAMASRSDLSARVFALLDTTRRRGRVGHAATVAVVGISCVAVLVIAPLRAVAAPVVSARVAEPAPLASEGVFLTQQSVQDVRGHVPKAARATRADPRQPAKLRAAREIQKSRRAGAEPRKPRVPLAIEKPERTAAEPSKPRAPRSARMLQRSKRAAVESRKSLAPRARAGAKRAAAEPRKSARSRAPRAIKSSGSILRDTTWKTQSTNTIIVSTSGGGGSSEGSTSHSTSGAAQHSASVE